MDNIHKKDKKIIIDSYHVLICNALLPWVRRRYCDVYTQRKYPYIYTLSISVDRNLSTKVYAHSNIRVHNHKVITGCSIILQAYYITDRRKSEN